MDLAFDHITAHNLRFVDQIGRILPNSASVRQFLEYPDFVLSRFHKAHRLVQYKNLLQQRDRDMCSTDGENKVSRLRSRIALLLKME